MPHALELSISASIAFYRQIIHQMAGMGPRSLRRVHHPGSFAGMFDGVDSVPHPLYSIPSNKQLLPTGKNRMKIALPSKGNDVDGHFGHCEFFTILTLDDAKKIVETETVTPPPGCGCKSNIVSTLVEKGVSVLLAGNMGQGAVNLLEASNIQVVRGCAGKIEDVVAQWLAGNVQDQQIVCDHVDCGHH